jgi:hypothetical protein
MTEFTTPVAEAAYFSRRLGILRAAQDLAASMRFDLARSTLSDDQIEAAAEAFGAEHRTGWNFGGLLEAELSRETPTVRVDDIAGLQRNLVAQGYAAPGTEPTGVWDSSWYGAFRRADADARAEFFQGHHPGAAPIEAGIRMITNTLPSAVWQGIVGTAKGLVEQAPETAERLGAAGGVAAGAAIGATFGSVVPGVGTAVGAGVGAVVGGVTGFFADLFGHEEGEEDQSAWDRVVDALSPWEEYTGVDGAKKFLEDLGWVASASSMVAGAGLAARGVAAGVGLAEASAEETGPTLLASLWAKRGAAESPGWFTRIAAWASRPALGAERVEKMVEWVRFNGLRAQVGRPIMQSVTGGYTGLSAAQTGSRLVAGIGTGTADLDAQIAAMESRLGEEDLSATEKTAIDSELAKLRAQKAGATTTIQRAIEETSPLPAYVDLLGFLVYPTQFFPVKASQVGAGMQKALAWTKEAGTVKYLGDAAIRVGGGTDLMPIANIVQAEAARAGESISLRQAVSRAKGLLGRDEFEQALVNTWYRRNFGVDMLAAERVADLGLHGAGLEGAFNKARAAVVAELHRPPEVRPVPQLSESKVVDESGGLLRVYHGTDREFETFDPTMISPKHDPGPGFYFTENPQAASEYALGYRDMEFAEEGIVAASEQEASRIVEEAARRRGLRVGQIVEEETGSGVWTAFLVLPDAAPSVRMAYLDIRRPFDWDAKLTESAARSIRKAVRESTSLEDVPAIEAGLPGFRIHQRLTAALGSKAKANEVLRRAGFDGITQIDFTMKGSEQHRVWVAFDPSQIHAAFRGPFVPDDLVGSSLAQRVLQTSVEDPVRFEAWMTDKRGPGSLPQYLEAERLATRVTQDIRSGTFPLEQSQIRGRVVSDAVAEWQRFTQTTRIDELVDQAERLEWTAKTTINLPAGLQMRTEARMLRVEIERLKADLPVIRKIERTAENMVIVPERLETVTSGEFHRLADEYRRLREQVVSNAKTAGTAETGAVAPGTAAWVHAKMQLGAFLDDLTTRIVVPETILRDASVETPGERFAAFLDSRAETAAAEIDLGPDLMGQFETLGYKPVVTSGDVLLTDDMLSMGELLGAGDYTRRAAVWDTMGLGLRKDLDRSIVELRNSEERVELDQVVTEFGLPISGRQAQDKLYDTLWRERAHGVTRGPLHFPEEGRSPFRLPKIDTRDLTIDDIDEAFARVPGYIECQDTAGPAILAAVKRGAALGAEARIKPPVDVLRSIGRNLRISGLPGFSDFVRTARVHDPNRLVALSTFAGAGLGLVSGDERLEDTLKGAAGGLLVGLGARAFARGAYGYLPDRLVRLNNVLRYSLSFTFDAGRVTEAASTMAARYDLPMPGLRPRKYIEARSWSKSPYHAGQVRGEEAWADAVRFRDELDGAKYLQWVEDIDRRASQVGLVGFNPREQETAYAWMMYQRGWSKKKIDEAVSMVNRYGLGRSAAEKSANFVFFPFSFSKKYLTTLGDWFLQAPARALFLQEGLRRYHASSLDEDFHALVEDHLPLLKQLARVNNLVYGVSPGRFFLQGLTDNRTNLGKVSQILASVFVPSGAATPLAQAAGGLGDFTIHAFVPVVVTGESIDRAGGIDGLEDVVRQYVPLVREIDQYFVQGEGRVVGGAVGAQLAALSEGRTPNAQYRDYVDQLREYKADLQPLALALGYASTDGLFDSQIGLPFKARYARVESELRQKYPTGASMADEFENTVLVRRRAIADIAEKSNRSEAEDAILAIAEEESKWRLIKQVVGLPPEIVDAIAAKRVRDYALRWANDRRFAELYEYLFAAQYGPIRRAA